MEDFPNTRPLRLRLFVVDTTSGSPLPNITLQARWVDGGVLGQLSPRLRTDANGYASFTMYEPDGAVAPEIRVFPVGDPTATTNFVAADIEADNSPRLLALDSSTIVEPTGGNLRTMSDPDPIDLLYTTSATEIPHVNLGLGLCGKLIPNTLQSSCFKFHTFTFTEFTPKSITFITPPGAARPNYIARQSFIGVALELDQCWNARGHSVGKILNSFPLAPCESVNIAILDYTRNERSFRDETSSRTENSIFRSNRDSLQYQSFRGMLHQSKTEWGLSGNLLLKNSVVLSGVMGNATLDQTTASAMLNKVTESLQHSSSAVATINSMVVMEASVEERKTLSTRTIGNHNHCHTLTIMYYEVVRNYLVKTSVKRGREVLFIQGPTAPWTIQRAHDWAYMIREALLDPSLEPCIDKLGEALCCLDHLEEGAACDPETCDACCCANRLVDHLNTHLHHYNAAQGLAEDANSRVAWMIEAEYMGQPLLSQVEPEPIGIFGGYLAFPLLNVDDIQITIPSKIQYISLPTKGVFAEGLLGNCNTCEVIEEGVHRNFKDDPCGCSAAEIPADFGKPGSNILSGSGLAGTTIGNLWGHPSNPFGSTVDMLSKLNEAFLDPELLINNTALTAAKDIALKIAEKLQAQVEEEKESGSASPDDIKTLVTMINFLMGFAGV